MQHLRNYKETVFYSDPEVMIIPISYIQHDIMFEKLWDNEEFKAIVKRDQDEKVAIRAQLSEMEERGELDL